MTSYPLLPHCVKSVWPEVGSKLIFWDFQMLIIIGLLVAASILGIVCISWVCLAKMMKRYITMTMLTKIDRFFSDRLCLQKCIGFNKMKHYRCLKV